jgi:hypothetical protein
MGIGSDIMNLPGSYKKRILLKRRKISGRYYGVTIKSVTMGLTRVDTSMINT